MIQAIDIVAVYGNLKRIGEGRVICGRRDI